MYWTQKMSNFLGSVHIIKNQININIDLPQRYLFKTIFYLKVGLANSKNTFSADSKFIFLFCNVSVIKNVIKT